MHRYKLAAASALTALSLVALTGCPTPTDTGDIDLARFNAPNDATASRIRGDEALVYVVQDDLNRQYDFFLAEVDQQRGDHELIASIPASNFGFAATDTLVAPTTISFSDNMDRGVIGFENRGSYLFEATGASTSQRFNTFTVTPLTAFGGTVFNPTINPFGTRIAFQTPLGQVGVSRFDATRNQFIDEGLLGPGLEPVFDPTGRLGFADPDRRRFTVADFGLSTVNRFTINDGIDPFSFNTPFQRFEAGFTPVGINRVGTFTTTAPLTFGSLQP